MSLIEERKLNLADKAAAYLPADCMEGLHVCKGRDCSQEITIRHLISNTSGLPDYFFYKENGRCASDTLLKGHDDVWGFEKTIHYVKQMKPRFAPGQKVEYSDTNYQLLGRIIETVTGQDIGGVFEKYIVNKLGLRNTYLYGDTADTRPIPFYHGSRRLWLPKYMASIGPEGGIVSTAGNVAAFTKAFFGGKLFDKGKIEEMKQWRMLMPPPGLFYFGIGMEKQPTPWILSPRKPIKEILGFWGQTSAYTWYNPETGLYFSGTANQTNASGHSAVMNAIIRIIKSIAF